MLIDIVNSYLKAHRRLVVPSFGAFVVKEGGEIIFSELLKSDDGVLRQLLAAEGLTEIEVAAAIDRFVFEVRHDLRQVGKCVVADFGTFHIGVEGVITFENIKPEIVAIPLESEEVAVAAAEVVVAASEGDSVTEQQGGDVPTVPVVPRVAVAPRPVHRKGRRSAGSGFVMWFAALVIAGALFALGYGLYCKLSQPMQDLDAEMDAQRIPLITVPINSGN